MLPNDLRYALRLLLRRPGFATVAILTLAIGIGTNTAIFSLVDRVILRAVPYPGSDDLVVVWETNPELPVPVMVASPPTLHDWITRNRSFTAIGAYRWRNVTFGGAEPEQIRGATVTAQLLRTLGVQPALGRWFTDDEDRPNSRAVVLLSDGLWRRKFQTSRDVLGRTVPIDGVRHEIVGVMPASYVAPPPVVFRGTPPAERAELWLPLATDLAGGQRGAHNLTVIARLRPGTSLDAADADVRRIALEVGREHPDYREWGARVVPLAGWVTASAQRSMSLLAAAVGFVLLLACANVANLLLARGVGRRREFAVRTALGAGRARLAAQVVGESLAIAIAGGVAGVALAFILIRLIVTRGPATIPGVREAELDLRALLFTVAIALVAALLAGVVPAIRVMHARVRDWLAERGAGQAAGGRRLQQALVVAQVSLAMALLVTAGLLVDSFRQLRSVDPGFAPQRVVTAKVSLPASRYPDASARAAFVDRLLTATRAAPGVAAVGMSDTVPMADNRQGTEFTPLGSTPADPSRPNVVNVAFVSDGFFESLGLRLVRGRTFTARDAAGGQPAVVINELLARQMYGDVDPIGRRVTVGMTKSELEVIGIVADDRHFGVASEPTAAFFVSYRQFPSLRDIAIFVSGSVPPERLTADVRAAVRQLDPELALFQVRTMQDVVDASVATPRSLAWLLSSFAISGLLLAAIGVFGVLSHSVSQRTQEIGVRIAVGASPAHMLTMIVGEGLAQVGLGVVLGGLLALATSQLLTGLLYGITTTALMPYVGVSVLLLLTAVVACLAPARRAMRVDPAVALRGD